MHGGAPAAGTSSHPWSCQARPHGRCSTHKRCAAARCLHRCCALHPVAPTPEQSKVQHMGTGCCLIISAHRLNAPQAAAVALDLAQLCCTWEAGGQLDGLELHFPLDTYQQHPAWWQRSRGGMLPALTSGGLLSQAVAALAGAAPEEPPEQAQSAPPAPPPNLAPPPAVAGAEAVMDAAPTQGTDVMGVAGMAQCHTSSWREVPAGSGRFCLLVAKQLDNNKSRLLLSGNQRGGTHTFPDNAQAFWHLWGKLFWPLRLSVDTRAFCPPSKQAPCCRPCLVWAKHPPTAAL
jgi:hypothetical protein